MKQHPPEDPNIKWSRAKESSLAKILQEESIEKRLAMAEGLVKAVDVYARIFREILELEQVRKSREALEGESIVDIVAHALERQYLLGTMSEDFDIIKKDRDDKTGEEGA